MTRYEKQKYYYVVTAFFIYATMIVDIFRDMSSMYFPGIASMVEPVRNVLYVGCFIYVLYLFIHYGIDKFDFVFTWLTVILWVVSVLLEPQIESFAISGILLFYSRVYVGFILLRHIWDVQHFADVLSLLMPISVFYAVICLIRPENDYMTMSYNLIPISLFNVYYGIKKKKIALTVAGAICFLIAGILGSRGALLGGILSIALWIITETMYGQMPLTKKRFACCLVVGGIMIIIVIFADKIIMVLSEVFVDSRTLKVLLNGSFLNDSGRSYIYERILNGIRNEPFTPHGLLSDRIISTNGTPSYLTYPHNLIYEIMYQFGIPLGCCVLFGIVAKLVGKALQIRRMKDMQIALLLAFVPVSFVQLMLSDSYLISGLFGITMGLLCSKTST